MDRLSTIEMGRRIVRNEGIGGLYRGLTPSLVGASTSWGLYFFFYERAKKRRQYDQDVTQLGMGYHMACACEAGVMTTFMTNPIWLVKTRLQLQRDRASAPGLKAGAGDAAAVAQARWQPQHVAVPRAHVAALEGGAGPHVRSYVGMVPAARPTASAAAADAAAAAAAAEADAAAATADYRGMTDAFRRIVSEEGPFALYKGIVPALILVSHGALQFTFYEELKVYFKKNFSDSEGGLSSGYVMAMGGISKIGASTATYPYQVVKTRLQARAHLASQYSGTFDCMSKIVRTEGASALFKGIVPNWLKVAPSSAITFVVYEKLVAFQRSRGWWEQEQEQ